jgi:hypothetical protein
MPDGAEFTDPVGYSGWWLVVCLLLVAAVAAYYYGVFRWAAAGELPEEPTPRDDGVEAARKACTARLAMLERSVTSGSMAVRRGYLELSAAVRGFVEDVGPVPARSMTLEQLRSSDQPRVAAAIEVMYPGEFAPEDADAEDFGRAVQQARELVVSWS